MSSTSDFRLSRLPGSTRSDSTGDIQLSSCGEGVVSYDQSDTDKSASLVIAPPAMVERYYVVTRRLEPKKRNRDRQWKKRPKVPSRLSRDFPWEVVLRFLKDHYRSLILLQMVDKNLNHIISTENKLWLTIFNREIRHTAYCIRSINDPLYPNLRLWKPHLNGLPVYTGPLRGDSDDSTLGFAFDASF